MTPVTSNAAAADAAVAPILPLPLDVRSARHGAAQFKLVADKHVPSSSEIFSRNCYEALGKPFNWHQLDRCGGFDAVAVRWTQINESNAGEDDLTYFQSETAATRYAKAALAGGLQVDAADQRWSAIQGIAAKSRLAAPRPVDTQPALSSATDENLANSAQNDAAGEQ